ncbi:MAG: dihydroorotase family protein [Thaumarchaeota archaeon]|nr:dihydroorotase family protein [Nitrososphaerota archaeon]
MLMIDLLIKNGEVLTAYGLLKTCIVVNDGKIVGLGSENLVSQAQKVIDASGKIVLPGLIDTHSHFREPGLTYKEDYTTGTMAGAAGGVTTAIDMPNVKPPTNTLERFEEKKKIAKSKAVIDFNHLVGVTDNKTETEVARRGERLNVIYVPLLEEIPKLAKAGAAGYKIFMADGVYPHPAELFLDDDGIFLELFEEVKKTRLTVSVHPYTTKILDHDIERFSRGGRTDPQSFWEARNHYGGMVWTSGIARLLPLQKATQVRLHVLHVHTSDSLNMIRSAKTQGQSITVEANPQHLFIKPSDIKKLGPFAVTATTEDNIEALWEALNDGTVDLIATDHAPHTKEEMEPGWKDIHGIPYGAPEIQDYLPLLLTEVNRGRISLETVSKLVSENVAKIFGIYPRKGVISIGSDADFVIVDMKREEKIKVGYTKCGWTPYEGRTVKGVPVITIVRGTVVMENSEILVKPGYGEWVPGPAYSRGSE